VCLLIALCLACSARGGGSPSDAGTADDTPAATTDTPATTDTATTDVMVPPTDVPATTEDVPTPPADVPVASEDVPVPPVDVPAPPVDVPAPPVDVPAPPVDVPAPPRDVPVPPMDVPGPTLTTSQQIAAVRAALAGVTSLRVESAIVTYVLPVTRRDNGSVVLNDPGGITVQAERLGPALFVAVDPATLSPAPRVGDRVSFTVTRVGSPMTQLGPWALEIASYSRTATGVSVAALVQDVSAAADLVSNTRGYEHELIAANVTLVGDFAAAGTGFVQAPASTVGAGANNFLRLRVTESVRTALALRSGCTLRLQSTPLWRYDTTTQLGAWASGDISNLQCPAPDAGVPVDAGPPPPDRLWVVRVGDEITNLSGSAVAVSIEAIDGSTGTPVGARIALPTAATGGNLGLTLSGVATAEGSLARSLDGRWVMLGGYNLPVGTPAVASTEGSRVIARINAAGIIDTRTALGTFASTRGLRAVVSPDGNTFWTVHAGGSVGSIGYSTYGGATSLEVSERIVLRGLGMTASRLFATGSNPDGSGVYAIAPLPTPPSRVTAVPSPGFPLNNTLSPYGLVPIDRDGDGNPEVLLLGDDRSPLSGGGVLVWTRSGTTWTQQGAVTGLPTGLRALTGRAEGSNYVLYGITAEGRGRILRIDVVGSTLEGVVQIYGTAPINTAYRGIAFAPR